MKSGVTDGQETPLMPRSESHRALRRRKGRQNVKAGAKNEDSSKGTKGGWSHLGHRGDNMVHQERSMTTLGR